jgi:hypothetical protein
MAGATRHYDGVRRRHFAGGGDNGLDCPYYESNIPPYVCDY